MIIQSFKMAWKSIASNKMRSFLTMLGIIIGVIALVVLVSLVSGTTDSVTDSINSLGSNTLTVTISDDKGVPLKLSDLSTFTDDEEIKEISPIAQSSVTASSTYSEETTTVYGTTGAYGNIQGLELSNGRFIMNTDIENHTNVAVISSDLAIDVVGRQNVVGETIKLNGSRYLIIGILAADDEEETNNFMSKSNSSSEASDYSAYIPYTSLIRLSDSVSTNITSFCISSTNTTSMEDAENHLNSMLLERFNEDDEAFTIINQSDIMEALSSVTNVLALLLGGIAGISLLVGGIGIMNIMLVSVTERTREIGIRKAIGASRGTIMLQFLIEAFVVSIMGCLIGILFSWIIIEVVNHVGDVNYGLSTTVVWIAMAFSTGIGLIFGLYPANKAASKRPIDALRYTC